MPMSDPQDAPPEEILADAARRLDRIRVLPTVSRWVRGSPVGAVTEEEHATWMGLLSRCDDAHALDALVLFARAARAAQERSLARRSEMQIVRIVTRLTADQSVALGETTRRFLVDRIEAGIVRRPQDGIDDVFTISIFRNPKAGRAFDWEFVTAALIALGEAREETVAPIAEALWRRHPWERIQTAAAECLRLLARTDPDIDREPPHPVHCPDR